MKLKHRIRSLERFRLHCSICNGKGKVVCIKKQDGEPDPPIAPEDACPGCGKSQVMRLVWVDEDSMGNRREPVNTHLSNRIKRVSQEMKRKHPCTVCHGRGKSVLSKIYEGDPEPPTPEGCPGCGEVTHYVIQYVHVPIIER